VFKTNISLALFSDAAASLNELWRQLKKHDMENEFQWSVIDRWNTHPLFIESIAQKIRYSPHTPHTAHTPPHTRG
jgi:protoheme ferro-lyase